MRDQVVVITGASGGIGAGLAVKLAGAGGRPGAAGGGGGEGWQGRGRGGAHATGGAADVTRRDDVRRVLDAGLAAHGHVDVWVNNAGRGITKPVSQLTDDDLDDMIRV